jgi:hypothetical protein
MLAVRQQILIAAECMTCSTHKMCFLCFGWLFEPPTSHKGRYVSCFRLFDSTYLIESEYISSRQVSIGMRDGRSRRLEDVGGGLLARLQE